ncbi:hypothetical protein quinque_015710 [Culex quinquefasciatus]
MKSAFVVQSIWTRSEKRTWFLTLLAGTCMLYSTRTTMPLLVPAVASERKWSKTDSGTVLSSFFWGYTLTQVLGGYLSDKFGGQKVILLAAIGWSMLTFWMPNIITSSSYLSSYSIPFIVAIRIFNGACQGVHFPSMISITSQNLCATERTSFFSILTSGSAMGTLLTGILGSFILDYFGWPTVFRVIGFLGLSWTLLLRYYTMSSDRSRIINISQPSRICSKLGPSEAVPWLRLFGRASFWACVLAHACEMNCFFVLLSWLPTYFHENFPLAKGWVQWSLTRIRKLVQSICFPRQNVALFIMCHTQEFNTALTCMSIIIGLSGFHNNAVTVNPQDLAPNHSGGVFGLMDYGRGDSGFSASTWPATSSS